MKGTGPSVCGLPLLNVLLRFVVFLCKIFRGGLAGYLDEGQLFAVSGHVARRLTHTEIVVSLHQEIWRGEKPEFSLTF